MLYSHNGHIVTDAETLLLLIFEEKRGKGTLLQFNFLEDLLSSLFLYLVAEIQRFRDKRFITLRDRKNVSSPPPRIIG